MKLAVIIGIAGGVAVAIGFSLAPAQAAFAYLTAWAFAMSIALGALIFVMTGHAMSARWTVAFQRRGEMIIGALPVLAILFVPIVVYARFIYPWLEPTTPAQLHRAAWLNLPFWTTRAAIYLVFWAIAGELMRRRPSAAIACVLLPLVGLTLTFAAFDWLMSLEPDWISTVYGLIYFAGGFVGALALIAATSRARPAATGALARLIHGFLIFWVYVEFSQGFIIWIANKPDEVPWYVTRAAGGWGEVLIAIAVGGFVLPFFALLGRTASRAPRFVAGVGAWLVALHYLDVYWLVMPVLHPLPALHWLDLAAPCAVLGLAAVAAIVRAPAPFAPDDPRVVAAHSYVGNDG
ncbi:MAG TPA: hypothetical protein VGG28_35025 [Kofleriaceae bacterium]